MSTMICEVYDAFVSAGTPEEKARKAAEALANYGTPFNRIEGEILKVQAELGLVKWMVGFAIALNAAILARLFLQ